MNVVIQCAASKAADAGFLMDAKGRPVFFVANPDLAPPSDRHRYARPDDLAVPGKTWRDLLVEYNASGENPSDLLPAYRLYRHPVYQQLVERYDIGKVFILSAGWGLIRADFLTANYDITFSNSAEKYKKRSKRDQYNDLCQLPDGDDEALVFIGGKDYLALFCQLTQGYRGERFVFYNSASPPTASGCTFIRYPTTTRTNWHYGCARDLMSGKIGV